MHLFLRCISEKMNKIIILFILVTGATCLYAQQPPAQLPPLLDSSTQQMPGLRQKASDIIHKNIFVKVETSTKTVYTGQPLLVIYKFYTALNSQARVGKQPAFNGCSVLELAADKNPSDEVVDGKIFHVFTIRKVQVTPLQEGLLELGPAYVENIVQFSDADGSGTESFSATLSNKPLTVEVKELPAANKPKDFSGLVGKFTIDAKVDSNKVPVGENAILHISIKGFGNIAGIRMPSVEWPAGTEHFESSDTQHIDQNDYPVMGSADFNISFIGTAEGQAKIPAVLFSYFDVDEKNYKTIKTNPVELTFTKAVTPATAAPNIVTEDIGNRKYLWIVAAIAITVTGVWLVSSKLKQKKIKNEKSTEVEIPANPLNEKISLTAGIAADEIFEGLQQLGNLTGEKDFLLKVKAFLTMVLQNKFDTIIHGEQELADLLKKNTEHPAMFLTCRHIYNACNRNLYSPVTDENIHEQLYFELTAFIKNLLEVRPFALAAVQKPEV